MNDMVFKIYALIHKLMQREEGQDLVEYSLTLAMVAFGCIASMNILANNIEGVFNEVAQVLSSNIS
jgi:Flp pilus assembly pilin Flp